MRTSTDQRPTRICVIGGGISGLAAAHRLVEESRRRNLQLEIRVLEATNRLGGVIETTRQEEFLFEGGPDSFITEKPWGVELCRKIGIESQLIGTSEQHRQTFIVRKGKLLPIPDGFYLLAPTKIWPVVATPIFSWSAKMRMAADLVLPRKLTRDGEDESLAHFVERRLGREALERIAQPLVGGIYTSDPEKLSLRATMPRFLEMERQHRSLILGMLRQRKRLGVSRGSTLKGPRYGMFVSFEEGMQVLIRSLEKQLPSSSIELGSKVSLLSRDTSLNRWRLRLANGKDMEAEAVCLALPAYQAGTLLAEVDPEIAERLRKISYASTITVNLAYRIEDIRQPMNGFGFVVPFIEGREILACTFSHVKFRGRAPKKYALLRIFMGGALQPQVFEFEDAELLRVIQRNLNDLLNINAQPVLTRIVRHPLSMAQYHVGHLDLVSEIEERLERIPTLQLAGNAFTGIGIPDCINRGEKCADRLLERFDDHSHRDGRLPSHAHHY
ncbi:MAG: protoporphyrinogen oxidase [Terriglobia bacterium]